MKGCGVDQRCRRHTEERDRVFHGFFLNWGMSRGRDPFHEHSKGGHTNVRGESWSPGLVTRQGNYGRGLFGLLLRQAAGHPWVVFGFGFVFGFGLDEPVGLLYALQALLAYHALLWINPPQALYNLENTVLRLGNVHVHSNVMLTRHHFSWTTRPLS